MPVNEPDELLAEYDEWAKTIHGEGPFTRVLMDNLAAALRAALAARPQPDEVERLRAALRQIAETRDLEYARDRARLAVAGSATPTEDHAHMMSAITGRCVVCDLTAEYLEDAAGSATPTSGEDDDA